MSDKENNEDYKIPEYEKKLKKIAELHQQIKNPEPERLLSEHRELESKLNILRDNKIRLYKYIKEIIENGFQLIQIKESGLICFFKGNWSQANHMDLCYFLEDTWYPSVPVVTFKGINFKEITSKEFMDKLMNGEGFLPRSL